MDVIKSRHTIWLSDKTWDWVKTLYKNDNCSTQNEFVEKALIFYSSYITCEKSSDYLPKVLSEMIAGQLNVFADHIGSLLYKQAVEQNIANHILAADTDMDYVTYRDLRGRSIKEVKSTNGRISLRQVIDSEQQV